MPTVEENVAESSWNYPSLYGDNQYTRWRILNQLFLVCGNGYDWEGGEIVNRFGDESFRITQEKHNERLRDFHTHIKLRKALNESGLVPISPMRAVAFYPLCKYSMVVSMPDNVTDDYLLWGMRFLDFATGAPAEWFMDMPAGIKEHFSYLPEREKAKVTEYREYFKYRFAERLASLEAA